MDDGCRQHYVEKHPGIVQILSMSDLDIRYTYGGTDAVIHIAEEMNNPERKISQAM